MTIASMMPSELNRICRSATAIGPFGSKIPSEQPPRVAATRKNTSVKLRRISDPICFNEGRRRARGVAEA